MDLLTNLPYGPIRGGGAGGVSYRYSITSQADLDNLPTLEANDTIGVQRGLVLRGRIRAPFNSAISGVLVEAYGTGTPPIIDCSDVIAAGQWTDNADGTWTCSVQINGNIDNPSTTYPVAYQDGWQFVRRVDAAGVVSGAAGGYWSQRADAGTNVGGIRTCTVTVKPFSGLGPILGSEEYTVAVRGMAIAGPDDWTVRGIHTRRPASITGSIVLGRNALVERCICEWGTKHNWLAESGVFRDVLAVNIADSGSGEAGTGGTMGVFYRGDATGLDWTMERCGFVQESAVTIGNSGRSAAAEGLLFHDNGGFPFRNVSSTQCWSVRLINLISGSPSGTISHTGDYGKNITSMFLHSTSNPSLTACLFNATGGHNGRFVNDTRANQTWTLRDCGISGTFDGASLVYRITANPTLVDIQNCNAYTPTDNEPSIRGSVNTWRFRQNHITSLGSLIRVGTGNTLDFASNYYHSTRTNPVTNSYLRDGDASSPYNSLALWHAATSQDAGSIEASNATVPLNAGYSGNPLLGDFRLTPGSSPATISAGMTQYWDWNSRGFVTGPAQRWPVVPETLADAITYISNPDAWNFYP